MMEVTGLGQTLTFLTVNLGYAIASLVVSVVALLVVDRYLFTSIDFLEEIKKGNLAASIFHSVTLLFIGLVVATALN